MNVVKRYKRAPGHALSKSALLSSLAKVLPRSLLVAYERAYLVDSLANIVPSR